jgi:hypothetical protein
MNATMSGIQAGSLRFPRWGTGAMYGPSVSTMYRPAGTARTTSAPSKERKVIIPVKEIIQPASMAASKRETSPGKQCNTPRIPASPAFRTRTAISSSASRQ